MAPNPETTQRLLVSAAEQLFAERGIAAVSLREITTAAGVRNSTAIQYHFDDREGVVRAVLRKHHPRVERDRHALLDTYEMALAAGAGDSAGKAHRREGDDGCEGEQDVSRSRHELGLRPLVGAFVRPAAAQLDNPDGGRAWLRIMAQLLNDPDPAWVESAGSDRRDSTYRWRQLVAPHLPDVAVRRLHRRFTAIRITFVELARRAEATARNDELFTSHLVDLVTAVLDAPLSDETAALVRATTRRPR